MPKVNRLIGLIGATFASVLALTAGTSNKAEAQSGAAEAYRNAQNTGTVEALEQFIRLYPLSDEANDAFAQIVVMTRGSVLDSENSANRGLGGIAGNRRGGAGGSRSGTEPY